MEPATLSKTNGTAAEHLSQCIDITGQTREQLAHRHAVMEPQGEIHRMSEEITTNSGRESLAHRLDVVGLHSLKSQTHQHGNQQSSNDQPQGQRAVQRLKNGNDGLIGGTRHGAQDRDGLTDKQRLERA